MSEDWDEEDELLVNGEYNRIKQLESELSSTRQELAEAQGKLNKTYCAYCGFAIDIIPPRAASAQIAEHIGSCPSHPMQKMAEACNRLERELAEAQRKITLCKQDYANIAEDMTKHLGKPFNSHATDAVMILLHELDEARRETETLKRVQSCNRDELGKRFIEIDRLRAEVEQLQVQLAGCDVAALGGTGEDQVAKPDSFGWSPAYQSTLELRRKYDELRAELDRRKLKWQTGPVPDDGFYFRKELVTGKIYDIRHLDPTESIHPSTVWAGPIEPPEE